MLCGAGLKDWVLWCSVLVLGASPHKTGYSGVSVYMHTYGH